MTATLGRFWLCPSCGKHVPSRIDACRCGATRGRLPDASPAEPTPWAAADLRWFAVGIGKLVALSILTFNLYQLYWFYQQWKRVRESGENVWPLPRALASLLFGYPLFRRMVASAPVGVTIPSAGLMFVGYILLCFAAKLPTPYGLLCLLSVLPLVPMQRIANAVAERDFDEGDRNEAFSVGNWLTMATGAALLAFVGYVYHRQADATSIESLRKIADTLNRGPRDAAGGFVLDRVVPMEKRLVYHYAVRDEARGRFEQARPHLKRVLASRICVDPLLRLGVSVRFVYADGTGRELDAVEVDPSDCR